MVLSQTQKYEWIVCNLEELSRSYYISREIKHRLSVLDYTTGGFAPHQHMCNVLVADIVIKWCKVFGSNNEEMHWKQFVEDEAAFRSILLQAANMTHGDYSEYWKELKILRDQVVAHFTFEYVGKKVPGFEVALDVACAAHAYFLDQLIKLEARDKYDLKAFGKASAENFLMALRPELVSCP